MTYASSAKIRSIFSIFKKQNPNPKSELIYYSPFELLIAVILSAQATDISVNKITPELFALANTPEKILALGEKKLKLFIKSIGLYNAKAKNIINACKLLIKNYHSQIPSTREELEALPGVGRKTANVLLNTLYNKPVIAVDTHVFRVANRIGLASGKTPLTVEKQLESTIPLEFKPNAHHWLLLHGRYICQARHPKCEKCLIQKYCQAFAIGL